ncbi:hypothetical protein GCM10014713_19960 [Streptomyces purpureus]|uniref:Uncharacterized protein n=1 Tax=Streptomyces purpureus TaxID=1951 RepID=A0A918GZD7_9ACTN|nr:hypothetical protein GCM10014713_19960 [Streptomyces purpureus]
MRCKRDPCACPRWLQLLWLLLVLGWVGWLLKELRRLCRLAGREVPRPADGVVPPWAYRQPDPLIYSQQYLDAQGLAFTWDNPDIHVELASAPGTPVDAHALQPDTDHVVVARIWNGSTTGPAPGLPVRVSYLAFGVGTTRHDIGMTKVDLPVKAASGCPAFASVPWRTPAAAGHYCLQVELLWDDDAEPGNNLGQSNTDVKALNSPHAAFTFPLRNDRANRAVVTLTADGYAIPPVEPCGQDRSPLDRHRPERWPVPRGWQVAVEPSRTELAPGEETEVTVDVTAPDGFAGRQAINVRAGTDNGLLGGVTLYVDGTG